MRNVAVRGQRDASLAGKYWNAVHKYLTQGDASTLEPFEDASIKPAVGQPILLVTDVKTLDPLASAGVFSFESIYARRI